MSDLQCPATFLLVGPDASEQDRRSQRIAASYQDVRSAGELDDLADLHRGETVLVRGPVSRWHELLAQRCGAPARGAYRVEIDGDGWRLLPLPQDT